MTLAVGHMSAGGIPTLIAGQVRLRAPLASDLAAYAAFCASPRAAGVGGPFPQGDAWHMLAAIAGQWVLRGYGRWIVADGETDAPLGVVGLHHPEDWPEPELAWTVFDGAEGRGVAHQAALAARAYAYDTLGWTTLMSCVPAENSRSAALAQRLGAVREGVFEHAEYGPLPIWRHPSPEALR